MQRRIPIPAYSLQSCPTNFRTSEKRKQNEKENPISRLPTAAKMPWSKRKTAIKGENPPFQLRPIKDSIDRQNAHPRLLNPSNRHHYKITSATLYIFKGGGLGVDFKKYPN
jgi:hypothetical protein